MTPARALTVCVGVSSYQSAVLEPGERPLEFLAGSARDLCALFQAAWPNAASRHLLSVDAAATRRGLKALLSAERGEYDLFVLYLGGHGRGLGKPFEFLFFGENGGDAVASTRDLDDLIAIPKAQHALLFLDACYAGKYAEESNFFRQISATGSRLCLASSLPTQKSWEDARFRRSLFSNAILHALTERPGSTKSARRVTAEFFDNVIIDVAQHAFGLKGSAAQEPALVGTVTLPISLPTAALQGTAIGSMTTFQVLLLRIRQIGITAVCVAAIGLAGLSIATWRPAVNGSGLVELRPGPKWLSPLNIGPWEQRVETDVTAQDLKNEQDDPNARAELRDERGIHPWPGLNRAHVRRWADIFLNDFLNTEASARWRVRLGYTDAVDRLTTTGRVILPTQTVTLGSATTLAAEAKILDPSKPLADVWRIQWQNNVVPGTCGLTHPPESWADQLSMYLHLTEPAEFTQWLDGLALTARADDAIGFEQVADLVKMLTAANIAWKNEYAKMIGAPGEPITAARIAARFTERPAQSEIAAVSNIAGAILQRRLDTGRDPVTSAERTQLVGLMNGCENIGARILAKLGSQGDPGRVIAWAHGRVDSDQGRLALRDLAQLDALPDSEIFWVLKTLGFNGGASDRKRAFVNAREWLSAIADSRPLPSGINSLLIGYASERSAVGDDEGSWQAMLVAARGAAPIVQSSEPQTMPAVGDQQPLTRALPPNDGTYEELGLLARAGRKLSAQQRAVLMSVLDENGRVGPPRITFTDEDRNIGKSSTQLVAGLTMIHLTSFARFVIGSHENDAVKRDPRTLAFLTLAIADGLRTGVPAVRLREAYRAAAIAKLARDGKPNARAIRTELADQPHDSALRYAIVGIISTLLASMPVADRSSVVQEMRAVWARESEPEVKLAIASTVIQTISAAATPLRAPN